MQVGFSVVENVLHCKEAQERANNGAAESTYVLGRYLQRRLEKKKVMDEEGQSKGR